MARLGNKKYRCGECGADQFRHWIETTRAARLRCLACGSARMDLVAAGAKKERAERNAARVLGVFSARRSKPRRGKIT